MGRMTGPVGASAPIASRIPPRVAGFDPAPARGVTRRAALLGLAGVCLVCGLTPYNDYVLHNTFMVGSYLPPVLAITFFVLVVFVNAPLHRLAPARALSTGELATVMGMMLVACSVPTQGLMRMLLPHLVSPFRMGAGDAAFWDAFVRLDLPAWLFPVPAVRDGINHPNVVDFYSRVQPGGPIPYAAWVVPLAAWGALVAAMWAALLGLSALVWRQWAIHERLPFPIAQVELALIDPPRPGRAFNDLLASRLFWVGTTGVLVLHGLAGLHQYFPRGVPEIPLRYDFTAIFVNEPWVHLASFVKRSRIYFTFIGISYFVQARVSFSLWAFLLIRETVIVTTRMRQVELPYGVWEDQYAGAAVVLVAWVAWVGRRYWAGVLRAAIRGAGAGTGAGTAGAGADVGGFLSPRATLGLLAGGCAGMAAWLAFMDVAPLVIAGLIGITLVAQLVTARVVAEAGLPFMRFYARPEQLYTHVPPSVLTGHDVYFAASIDAIGPTSTREGLVPFATHALQVAAGAGAGAGAGATTMATLARERRRFVALLAAALAVGYVVAAASSLRAYYSHATPITPKVQLPLNEWGAERYPRSALAAPLVAHAAGRYPPRPHARLAWTIAGAAIMAGLYVATVRVAGWPLVPLGYLLCSAGVLHLAAFSLFLGWLTKVLLVRFGGAGAFLTGKPLFIGLILGEALAAGMWLLVTFALAAVGYHDYESIRILPG